ALDLGTGWASTPVAVLFAGNRYEVKLMNDGWRNPKKPFAVKFPILNDGLHGATVVLQNGQQVPVLLSVHTTFFP
ncbi:MAG TPA: hypothetical protein VLC93_19275, partial [Myxococcota bacterium]|nr:hypothetical protein [Myxococcota bacterium]